MPLFPQSALLKALGWSLFNSLWQMALLWLIYILVTNMFRRASAGMRHFLALSLLGMGAGWFILSFIGGMVSTGEWGFFLPAWVVSRSFIDRLLPCCSFFYLVALVFLFARYSNYYFHSKRLKLTGLTKIRPELRVFVEETRHRMGIGKKVRVWLSSLVEVPVTLGFFKPVILIPLATINNLSPDQVETILLHELAHIKQYDYLLNLGVTVLELVFFFNPFARWLIQDIKREREHRCDDLVMQFRYDPVIYISALLSLASSGGQRQELALAATGKNDRLLLHRVKRILKQKSKEDRPGTRPVIFLLLTMLFAFIGFTHPAHSPVRGARGNKQIAAGGGPVMRSAWAPGQTAPDNTRGLAFVSSPLESSSASVMRTGDEAGRASDPVVIRAAHFFKEKTLARSAAGPRIIQQVVSAQSADEAENRMEDIVLASNKGADNDDDQGYEQVQDLKLSVAPVVPEAREYSIKLAPLSVTVTLSAADRDEPFVPNSSFSAGHTESPAYQTLQQVNAANKAARDEMERGMKLLNLQQDALNKLQQLQLCSIKPLREISQGRRPDILQLKKELLDEQSKLRKEYLQKQQEALKKLPLAQRKKIIIYI